jgi:uncharacterized protein YpiB (UPF0302 family)
MLDYFPHFIRYLSSDDILMESEPEHHENRNELSNSDQMSLMNTVIYRALERQRKILIDHIDSKLDTVNRQGCKVYSRTVSHP